MSTLRASVCKKLGLSATASQTDVYRAALKKIRALGSADEMRTVAEMVNDWRANWHRPEVAKQKAQEIRRYVNAHPGSDRAQPWDILDLLRKEAP